MQWRKTADVLHKALKINEPFFSTAELGLNPDGTIATGFTFRKKYFDLDPGKFTAKLKVLHKETNAEWKVYFLGGWSTQRTWRST